MKSYGECLTEIDEVAHEILNASQVEAGRISISGLKLAQNMTEVELEINPYKDPLGNVNGEIEISLKKESSEGFQHFLITKSPELIKRDAAGLIIFKYVPPWGNQFLPNIGGVGKEQYDYLDSSVFWGPIRRTLGLGILNLRGMNVLASEMTPIKEKFLGQ